MRVETKLNRKTKETNVARAEKGGEGGRDCVCAVYYIHLYEDACIERYREQ